MEKKYFPIKREKGGGGVNNCFKSLILPGFATATSIRTKRKGKINLETTYNVQYLLTLIWKGSWKNVFPVI